MGEHEKLKEVKVIKLTETRLQNFKIAQHQAHRKEESKMVPLCAVGANASLSTAVSASVSRMH